ncbi:MAG: glycosyltransferase family 4 protein [Flavobacteriaceae bacterium]|nr:glycosyltransferase family 4 protein [Flavobacteriaceae bacterium]
MDYFFWLFDKQCKQNGIQIDWFFPNKAIHGDYSLFHIIPSGSITLEQKFIDHIKSQSVNYTHIITHFLELCTPFFYKVKQVSKAKIIGVDHNPRPLEGYTFNKKINKKLKGLLFSRYIDSFIGVSEYTIKELLKDFGKHLQPKTQVIYNGINILGIELRTTRSIVKPTFLTASHLRRSKGIQDLINAVALLPEPIKKSIKIDIFGDGPYKLQLLSLVTALNLENCFNFKGSSSQLNAIYCKYDYLIHPSHEETFCYSVIEALVANVVPVTTEEGGNVLKIIENKKNGFLFKAKDIAQLSNLILQIWEGKYSIEINTRKSIETRFSIDKMVDNYLNLLL